MRDMYWYKKLVSVILVMSILFPLFSNALTRVEAIGIDSLELSKECNIFNYKRARIVMVMSCGSII